MINMIREVVARRRTRRQQHDPALHDGAKPTHGKVHQVVRRMEDHPVITGATFFIMVVGPIILAIWWDPTKVIEWIRAVHPVVQAIMIVGMVATGIVRVLTKRRQNRVATQAPPTLCSSCKQQTAQAADLSATSADEGGERSLTHSA